MKDSIINLRYNELKYAEIIETNGFQTKYHTYELRILAKYYKHQGFKPKQRKEMIYEFCNKYIAGFNKVKYYKTINSVLNHAKAKNNNLIIIKQIPVTVKEIDYINYFDIDYLHKKILFTLLVQDKIKKEVCMQRYGEISKYHSYGGNSKKYKELIDVSKIQTGNSKVDINEMISNLANMNLVEIWSKGKINAVFLNEIEVCDNIAFTITSFDDVGYYLDYHNGLNNIEKCEVETCGVLFKKRGNNHRMCAECWKECDRELNKERCKRYYKNKKGNFT